ncbi:MAG: serine/threonine-protein kinase, partial [Myxococcota bacterium]
MDDTSQTSTSPRGLSGESGAPSGGPSVFEDTLPASDAPTPDAEPTELAQGTLIGRYVVLSKLGAGAMGVVYGAFDPELDRKVAVKLLLSDRGSDTARARLLREAQALARLAHPNVVAVHDVGVHGEQVFVAMEFVEGQTLRQWRKAETRSFSDVLRVLAEAGRGLEAAHARDLVHRDFKPDNVMVGDDGRVRVMDFGLARANFDSNVEIRDAANLEGGNVDITATLTVAGAMPGTPAYMSAEQWSGQGADPASDQFSFCTTFWECLYGERPFAGEGYASLGEAIQRERVREPPSPNDTPAWLRRIVRRGLCADPKARWPSLGALLAEIDRARRHAQWRWARIGAGVVVVSGGRAFAFTASADANHRKACARDAQALSAHWNEEARTELNAAFAKAPGEYGAQASTKVTAALDAWTEQWREASEDACLHPTAELQTEARACLDTRFSKLAVLVASFKEANAALTFSGYSHVLELPSPADCRDVRFLRRQPHLSSSEYKALHQIRESLAAATRFQLIGLPDQDVESSRATLAEAELTDVPLAVVEAKLHLAEALGRAGEFAEALTVYTEAYTLAGEIDEPSTIAAAATGLASLMAVELRRFAEARIWAQVAEVALSRLDDETGLTRLEVLNARAAIEIELGDYARGRELLEEALEIQQAALGNDHPLVARTVGNMGYLIGEAGYHVLAVPFLRRAIAATEKSMGSGAPAALQLRNNLANSLWGSGQIDEGLAVAQRCAEEAARSMAP